MNTDTILKIFNNTQITEQELSEFIVAYVKKLTNKEVTPEQLSAILRMFGAGYFNLYETALMARKYSDDIIYFLHDSQGNLIKVFKK